ncbi:carboxylating nicotinate-nucleotide diphosphorylase [Nanoarchaeota archaeon]
MTRTKKTLNLYSRKKELSLTNSTYKKTITAFFNTQLKQDLGKGDITANALIKTNKPAKAIITAKESGVMAGLEEINFILKNKFKTKLLKKDGQNIKKGNKIIEIRGKIKDILKYERTVLNILQRMSGIATTTNKLANKTKGKCFIVGTRKTNWPELDKKAIEIGGGLSHRLGLDDAILIKENHLVGMDNNVEKALTLAKKSKKKVRFIEIEVKTETQAIKATETMKKLKINNGIIMLDNFSPNKIKSTISKLKKNNLYNQIIIEASGGITPKNISKYANSGIDVISTGYITHSAKALDLSMLLFRE